MFGKDFAERSVGKMVVLYLAIFALLGLCSLCGCVSAHQEGKMFQFRVMNPHCGEKYFSQFQEGAKQEWMLLPDQNYIRTDWGYNFLVSSTSTTPPCSMAKVGDELLKDNYVRISKDERVFEKSWFGGYILQIKMTRYPDGEIQVDVGELLYSIYKVGDFKKQNEELFPKLIWYFVGRFR